MNDLRALFATYETHKLVVTSPWGESVSLLCVLLLAGFFWQGRRTTTPLDPIQTCQVRGLAITLVIVGHLWVHVVGAQEAVGFGAQAVSAFLLLSGYGLRLSARNTPPDAPTFLKRRLLRVMLPYWLATLCIFAVDYVLLGRSYSPSIAIRTLAGINLDDTTWYIDYVRWYVTFLLVAYALFFMSYRWFGEHHGLVVLFFLFSGLYLLRLKGPFPLGTYGQIFAFPLGCLFATYKERLVDLLACPRSFVGVLIATLSILAVAAWVKANNPVEYLPLKRGLDHAALIAYDAAIACVLVLVFVLLGQYDRVSTPFNYLGSISYELYLLHGPLLIKYDPILHFSASLGVGAGFILWFIFLLPVAAVFSLGAQRLVRLLQG